MSYLLKSITIRTDNSKDGLDKINQLWQDISIGKIAILFDNEGNFQHDIIPISKYSNYESDEKGLYDLSIIGVKLDFFEEMEKLVSSGSYLKIEESGETIAEATFKAWKHIWDMAAKAKIKRTYTEDFESSIMPQYSKDNKAHCYLYIAIE